MVKNTEDKNIELKKSKIEWDKSTKESTKELNKYNEELKKIIGNSEDLIKLRNKEADLSKAIWNFTRDTENISSDIIKDTAEGVSLLQLTSKITGKLLEDNIKEKDINKELIRYKETIKAQGNKISEQAYDYLYVLQDAVDSVFELKENQNNLKKINEDLNKQYRDYTKELDLQHEMVKLFVKNNEGLNSLSDYQLSIQEKINRLSHNTGLLSEEDIKNRTKFISILQHTKKLEQDILNNRVNTTNTMDLANDLLMELRDRGIELSIEESNLLRQHIDNLSNITLQEQQIFRYKLLQLNQQKQLYDNIIDKTQNILDVVSNWNYELTILSLKKIWEIYNNIESQALDLRLEMGMSRDSTQEWYKLLYNSQAELIRNNLELKDMRDVIVEVTNIFGRTVEITTEIGTNIAKLSKGLGLGVNTTTELLDLIQNISSESLNYSMHMLSALKKTSEMNKLPTSSIMKDIASNSEFFATYSKDAGQNIMEAAVYARRLGLSLSHMSKITEQLLDFEGSISRELEASVLLGQNINFNRARELLFVGKQTDAYNEINRQMGRIGEFDKLNFIQKQAIANSLGLSVEETAKWINKQKILNQLNSKQITMAEALSKGLNVNDVMDASDLNTSISSLTNSFKALGVSILTTFMPLMSVLTVVFEVISKIMEKLDGPFTRVLGSIIVSLVSLYTIMAAIHTLASTKLLITMGSMIAATFKYIVVNGILAISFKAVAGAASVAWSAILGPVGIVIGAILLIAGAAYLIYKNWDSIADFFKNMWESIKKVFINIGKFIQQSISSIIGWVKNNWGSILFAIFTGPLGLIHLAVKNLFPNLYGSIKEGILNFGNIFINGFKNIISNFASSIGNLLFGVLVSPFVKAWDFLFGHTIWDVKNILGVFEPILGAITQIFTVIGKTIIDLMLYPFTVISKLLNEVIGLQSILLNPNNTNMVLEEKLTIHHNNTNSIPNNIKNNQNNPGNITTNPITPNNNDINNSDVYSTNNVQNINNKSENINVNIDNKDITVRLDKLINIMGVMVKKLDKNNELTIDGKSLSYVLANSIGNL